MMDSVWCLCWSAWARVGDGNGRLQSSVVCGIRTSHSHSPCLVAWLWLLPCSLSILGSRLMLGPPSVSLPGLWQGERLAEHLPALQGFAQKSLSVTAFLLGNVDNLGRIILSPSLPPVTSASPSLPLLLLPPPPSRSSFSCGVLFQDPCLQKKQSTTKLLKTDFKGPGQVVLLVLEENREHPWPPCRLP